ncbi:MAG: hypothetical protein WAM30_11545 [Candidatus Dormiibacterota bacterium]
MAGWLTRWLGAITIGAALLAGLGACGPVRAVCGEGAPPERLADRPPLVYTCLLQRHGEAWHHNLFELTRPGAVRLTDRFAEDEGPAADPTGSRLAYSTTLQGAPEIYVANADAQHPVAHGVAPGGQSDPAWSPDGRSIVYASGQDGLHHPLGVAGSESHLYVLTVSGDHTRRLTDGPTYDAEPAWSRTGGRIAFTTDRDGRFEIASVNPQGGALEILTSSGGARWPTWSPNGKQIAFQSTADADGSGPAAIWVMDADGSHSHEVTDGAEPAWSPDGKWIAFVRSTPVGTDLWMIPPAGGKVVRLTDDAGTKHRPTWLS